jgi:hypothetical protein
MSNVGDTSALLAQCHAVNKADPQVATSKNGSPAWIRTTNLTDVGISQLIDFEIVEAFQSTKPLDGMLDRWAVSNLSNA